MKFDTYVLKEAIADKISEFGEPCVWGETTPAKAHEGLESNGHKHRFVVDRNGYGKTSMATDIHGNGHWHTIHDFEVDGDGTHTHEIKESGVKGTCGYNNDIDCSTERGAVDIILHH